MKMVSINKFLSQAEIEQAARLYRVHTQTGKFAAAVNAEIITPNIERINKALGQENDPQFLAYMVEFVFMQVTPGTAATHG